VAVDRDWPPRLSTEAPICRQWRGQRGERMRERALEKWALMRIARLKRWGEPKLVMMLIEPCPGDRLGRLSLPLARTEYTLLARARPPAHFPRRRRGRPQEPGPLDSGLPSRSTTHGSNARLPAGAPTPGSSTSIFSSTGLRPPGDLE
jgi:hypothetical protein